MNLFKFIHYYLNPLIDILAKEQKTIFLLGDFNNVDLLKYEQYKATNGFTDSLSSNMFLPHIVQPTRITSHPKTLIYIFSNYNSQAIVSGNLTATISDHLPQFFIAPHILSNVPNRKTNIFEDDWSKFNIEEFILDYCSVDWSHTLKFRTIKLMHHSQTFLTP